MLEKQLLTIVAVIKKMQLKLKKNNISIEELTRLVESIQEFDNTDNEKMFEELTKKINEFKTLIDGNREELYLTSVSYQDKVKELATSLELSLNGIKEGLKDFITIENINKIENDIDNKIKAIKIEPQKEIEIGKVYTLDPGEEAKVEVKKTKDTYKLDFYIPRGVSGRGQPGKGVPSGGTTNQVLAKNSNDDYDTKWVTGGGGSTSDHSELTNLDYASSGHTGFQPTLVSGTSIKTINNTSLLGSGNITITGGDGRSIDTIVKTGTLGLVDTYTITYSDETTSTFDITNGADGEDGADGLTTSVNGVTQVAGAITIDPDDLDDSLTAHKFVTATDLTNLTDLTDNGATTLHKHSYNNLDDKPTIPTLPVKASGAEINAGTDDAKFATSKAISDSKLARIIQGTSSTARTTAAKTTTIADYTLRAGDTLAITFSDGFSVNNPTLNVNGGGDIAIRAGAVAVTTALLSVAAATSFTLNLYYDGTYFYIPGSQLNTTTTYTEISEAEITAGTASTARSLSGRRSEFIVTKARNGKEDTTNKENTTIDTSTTKYPTVNLLKTGLDTKQATLVSGTNIKTINSTTLLGSGDLTINEFTDEKAQDAVGSMVDSTLTYIDATPVLKVTNPVTPQTTGFTITAGTTPKTLTVSDTASVTGTNTGDQTTVTGSAGSLKSPATTGVARLTGMATGTTRDYTVPDSNATLLYSGGALGTPSSGTVTNLTGTASININGTVGATTPDTGTFTTVTTSGNLELGHATDTTIARTAAGKASIEGDGIVTARVLFNDTAARQVTISSAYTNFNQLVILYYWVDSYGTIVLDTATDVHKFPVTRLGLIDSVYKVQMGAATITLSGTSVTGSTTGGTYTMQTTSASVHSFSDAIGELKIKKVTGLKY